MVAIRGFGLQFLKEAKMQLSECMMQEIPSKLFYFFSCCYCLFDAGCRSCGTKGRREGVQAPEII
jgi:hypothetical protein